MNAASRCARACALLLWATSSLAPAATATGSRFTIATAPYRFVWPRDHAAHPGYQSEWWYYTGHLHSSDGHSFGYELTFFRFGLAPGDPGPPPGRSKWRGNELYPAHFAITDETGKTFFYRVRFAREALGMGAASAQTLDVRTDDWTLRGAPLPDRPMLERMALHAREAADGGDDAIDLVQIPRKPPAVHGHGGVSRKAACASCASHYYSYTRLASSGTLELAGRRYAVTGLSWMDHEFGSAELQSNQAGWDWFSIQLDDGRELMAYLLRQKGGSVTPESSGSLIAADGSVRYLPREALHVSAIGAWKSPHTGAVYPSGWRVQVPAANVDIKLEPTVDDQELATTSGSVSYWEGAVSVRDTATDEPLGAGYVELTGYAQPISL